MKRTPLRKVSLKKRKTKSQERKVRREELTKVFLSIWSERPHFCYETNVEIKGEPLSTMFHHVLEKHKYPEYQYEKWNIVILLPEVHEQVHLNIDKTPRVKNLKNELENAILVQKNNKR